MREEGVDQADLQYVSRGVRALAWLLDRSVVNQKPRFFDLIIACILSVVVVARLALTAGVPAFQQDWNWPTSSATLRGWFELSTLPWNWNGLGNPQIYPFADYFVSFAASLAMIIGSKVVLVTFLALTIATAGFSAALLLRRIGVQSRLAIVLAIVAYTTSPVIFNKLAAGHTYYLIGYALLPALCAQLMRLEFVDWKLAAPAIALELAASFTQAQYIIFDFAVIALWIAIRNRRLAAREAVSIGIGTLIALIVHGYPIVALFLPQAGFLLAHQHATIDGVASESVNLHDLLIQDGYPPAYFRRVWTAYAAIEWSAICAGCFAVLSLVAATWRTVTQRSQPRFNRDGIYLVLGIVIFGTVLVLGLNGPASPILRYAFVHIPATSILKELYHAMVLVALGVAVGIGLGTEILCGAIRAIEVPAVRRNATIVIQAFTITLVVAAWPTLNGGWLDFVGLRDATAFDAVVARRAPTTIPQRFLAYPITPPMRSAERSAGGGNDSDASRPWNESSLYMGAPDPALAYLETATTYGPEVRLDYLFRRYGIATLIDRKRYVSVVPAQMQLPPDSAERYSSHGIASMLTANGTALKDADDAFLIFQPNRPYDGMLLAGGAPIRAGDDVALADQDLAGGRDSLHQYSPLVFSSDLRFFPEIERAAPNAVGTARTIADWRLPSSRFADPADSISGFDPNLTWTSIQNSYVENRWQNFSPVGGIYTQSTKPLIVRVPAAGVRRYVAALVAAGDTQRNIHYTSNDNLSSGRLMRVGRASPSDVQHFTWYVSAKTLRSNSPLAFTFDHQLNGVAIASIAFLNAGDLRDIQQLTPGVPDRDPHASIHMVRSDPTSLSGIVANSDTQCSLTLLTNYDGRWSLKLDRVLQAGHFRADGWANGWTTKCGTHDFTVAYDGHFFTLALRLGWIVLVVCMLAVVFFSVRTGTLRRFWMHG